MRSFLALTACASVCFLSPSASRAATPSSGTLTDSSGPLAYTAGPFLVANPTAQANDDSLPTCDANTPCDDYTLTVNVAPEDAATMRIRVAVSWPNSRADFDLYVLQNGVEVKSAASSADPEIALVPAVSGTYTLRVAPFLPLGQSFAGTITLEPIPTAPPPDPGVKPRFKLYAAPNGLGTDAGEPSMGINHATGNVFFESYTQTLRISLDDCSSPAQDQWVDRSAPSSVTSLDPILFTDSKAHRTFVSQLVSGGGYGLGCSLSSYTDDDGETWIPSNGCGTPAGADHQTIGGGPFAPPLTRDPQGPLYPNAAYYCSQGQASAFCARSDNGGLDYGAGVPIYSLLDCTAIHGHIKVAPDGTVYVPNRNCSGNLGVVVSEDNGLTWNIRRLPETESSENDPSLGIASDGTVYFGFQNGDGRPRVAVSHDRGLTWQHDQDVGVAFDIRNTVFPVVVAGDPQRASFSFLGTSTPGNFQAADFAGVWHLYSSFTYDGGEHWVTVDVTPNDPVQRGCVWLQGGTNTCRNLLDFMDASMDAEGRVLVAIADGCTGSCVASPPNSYNKLGTIARQSGGRRLLAAFDPAEPAAPAAPRLESATRSSSGVLFRWSAPDDGGSPLTGYEVFRRESTTTSLLTVVAPDKTSYLDTTADPSLGYFYSVKAVNAQGESPSCREVPITAAPPTQSPCTLPGVEVFVDGPGDNTDSVGEHDVRSLDIAEPFVSSSTPDQLVFTLKVGDLTVVPPQSRWTVFFSRTSGTEYFVDMTSDDTGNPAGVAFHYGHTSIDETSGLRNLTTDGAADAGSSYSADGTIVIKVSNDKLTFNLSPPPATLPPPGAGEQLVNINAIAQQTLGVLLATLDSTGSGSYFLVGNQSCRICTDAPSFDGVQSVVSPTLSSCALDLAWAPALTGCAGLPVRYNVYRGTSASFTPAPGNAVALGVMGTSYRDADNLTSGATYTYIVRAEDLASNEDTNLQRLSGTPHGLLAPGPDFSDDVEPTSEPGYEVTTTRTVGTWAVSVDPTAHSLQDSWVVPDDQPGLPQNTYRNDTLVLPPLNLTSSSVLTFWHNFDFARIPTGTVATRYRSGGVVEISNDGNTWIDLGADASGNLLPYISAPNRYNGVVSSSANEPQPKPLNGRQAFVGSSDGDTMPGRTDAMRQVTINVGQAIQDLYGVSALPGAKVRFRMAGTFQILGGGIQGSGWGVDDMRVSHVQAPGACATDSVPSGRIVTELMTAAKATGGQITLSWGRSCSPNDTDFEIYEGSLPNFYTHTSIFCSTGGAATQTFTPASGSSYYIVVTKNQLREGSYGARTGSIERPQGVSACLPQEIGACP